MRALFTEYVVWLGLSLDFQNYEDELSHLPGKYVPPLGQLYLLLAEERIAGCVALRPFDTTPEGSRRCEMKRLFVRKKFRGQGFGRLLAQHIIERARTLGYDEMLLDTFASM